MTTPDLAALRTLVDAVERWRSITAALDEHQGTCDECRTGWASAHPCGVVELYAQLRGAVTAIAIGLPAAQATLERMDLVMIAPNGRPCDPGCWPHDHSSACYRASVLWLRARLAELKEAQAQAARDVAYWRRRTEGAEALVVTMENRSVERRGLVSDLTTVLEKRNARVARLEEALLKYAQHEPRCPIWIASVRGTCTCGLDAALEGRDASPWQL